MSILVGLASAVLFAAASVVRKPTSPRHGDALGLSITAFVPGFLAIVLYGTSPER